MVLPAAGASDLDFSEPEKAWLAGVIDSEGTVWFRDTLDGNGWLSRQVSIEVVNTNLDFARRVQELMETPSIKKEERASYRSQKPLYRVRQHDHKKVLAILRQVMPYLIIKRSKAKQIVNFVLKTDWNHRRFSAKRSEYMRRKWAVFRAERWSWNYFACTKCGETNMKHRGKGLCRRCYRRQQYVEKGF